MRCSDDTILTLVEDARTMYTAAYAAHYTAKDLHGALEIYSSIMATYPDTPEAGYSRSQIQHIANAVVPKQMLLDAHVDLALACFEQGEQADS